MALSGNSSRPQRILGVLLAGLLGAARAAPAPSPSQAQQAYLQGEYAQCLTLCQGPVREGVRDEEWPFWLVRAQLTLGRYAEAASTLTNAMARHRYSIRLRLLGYEVFRANGQPERARQALSEINELGGTRMWSYQDPPNLVALGEAAVLLGADPKLVLERFFEPAKRADPKFRGVYLASGELALAKHDYALAAKLFAEGLQQHPEDPDLHRGLAQAYEPSQRPKMLEALEAALEANPRHVPSLLLQADHAVDAEEYAAADQILDQVLAVNPWQPDAWAYRAVLRHLESRTEEEARACATALKFWPTNPRVPHLIGQKLSQKYRFAEGATWQRQALAFDPVFLPARIQLAQDLLRLGQEDEGWEWAQGVHTADGYDITAYNLVTLRDTLGKFQTLTNADFVVRMSPSEAALYGDRVLALLAQAKDRLAAKYGFEPERPTTLEIFPNPKDFGVRTFGLPDNPGFLGVCFGRVVTANSPASQAAHPANWQAVLWHEFAHVITLQLTRNKMPRWLSEGISVYEERQANPVWGQQLNPVYREMVLEGELTPIGELSAAFLAPKSPLHLQFAYLQSAMVVEFLVERYGFDSLKRILRDLGQGRPINDALTAHTAPLPEVETLFTAYARTSAERLAPGLDWDRPGGAPPKTAAPGKDRRRESARPRPRAVIPASALASARDSTNYWVLSQAAEQLVEAKRWQEAQEPLRRLLSLYPDQRGPGNAYSLLAQTHRELRETEAERDVLTRLAARDPDAVEAFGRLLELDAQTEDWAGVRENGERFLAVNPLLPQPYRHLARAYEELGLAPAAIQAWRALLRLDPADPVEAHFQLACLLRQAGDPSAKRHVLQALEEAPRFREAYRLLRELQTAPEPPTGGDAPVPVATSGQAEGAPE